MDRLRNAVVRVKGGAWLCRAPVILSWSNGPSLELVPGVVYEAGVRYRGMDIGTVLDDCLSADRLPPNIRISTPLRRASRRSSVPREA